MNKRKKVAWRKHRLKSKKLRLKRKHQTQASRRSS